MVDSSTWKVIMFTRVEVLVFLFLARVRFLRNKSVACIVRKRYSREIGNTISKFEKVDYKLRKAKFDINFIIRCQRENAIPNFPKFRLTNKDLRNSVTYIKYQHNLLQIELSNNKLRLRLCKMNLIVCAIIYNLAWSVLILSTFLPFFLVAMIIF